MEINTNNGQIRLIIYDGNNQLITMTQTGHYKIIISDKLYFYCDENLLTLLEYDTTQTSVELRITNSVANTILKFRDLMIYPI